MTICNGCGGILYGGGAQNHDCPVCGPPELAKRDPVPYRFDILYWRFMVAMATIAAFGAAKYGDFNWQKSRLEGGDAPPNHIARHLASYLGKEPYDHLELGPDSRNHLVAIAFNAMMEYWYEENFPNG